MKWVEERTPECFHCRNLIKWPYCSFYRDGISQDIQMGAFDRCDYYSSNEPHSSILQRVSELWHRHHR
jgi:hypothetical protein